MANITEILKRMPRTIRVGSLPGGASEFITIAGALAVAQAGDTIELYPGTYAESNLVMKNRVNIVGEGWGISIIETLDNANPIIAMGNNITCEIHGVKISNLGTGGAIKVNPVANNDVLTLEDCWVTASGAGDCVVVSIGGAGSGTLNARRCDLGGNAATSITKFTRTAGAGLLYFNSWDCNFTTSGGAANAAIEASATVVCDVNVFRATFTSCTSAVYSISENHTIDIYDSYFNNSNISLVNSSPVVNLVRCTKIGDFDHSTTANVTLRECYIQSTYVISAVAGILTAYYTLLPNITNNGSGAVALYECTAGGYSNNGTSTTTIVGGRYSNGVTQAATAGRINISEAALEYTITCGATGIIRIKNCSYRAISRAGTGNIVDESPMALNSIYHVSKKFWEVALAANMNIATRTAVGGLVTVGGGGQARLRISDLALDAAGVESPADAAGALASTFLPATTPRYVQQISVNAFRATTTMFFGLRAVLGAAVPTAAEHHAGFIWNGANFIASSSNGGGVGGTTNLTTPSTGVQHQLEVIILGGVQVEFYVDGVLVATHTTAAKIPTAALYFQEYEISTGAGGATTSDITLREGFLQECPA